MSKNKSTLEFNLHGKFKVGKTTDNDKQRIQYSDGKYEINVRMMYSNGRSIGEYKSLYNILSQI